MFCTHCGLDLGPSAKFCSACGNALSEVSTQTLKARDWDFHVNVLGWLVIAHSALVGAIGIVVMFGSLFISRLVVENPSMLLDKGDPPPEFFTNVVGPAGMLIGFIFLFIALPSVIAGIGLLRYRKWGRTLTLVLSFLRLLEFPFGTATAVYSFWVLLSKEGKRFYGERAARAEA